MLNHFSCVRLLATLWSVACQAPLSMGFSRQEYWSGLLCAPLEDLPDPGIEPASPATPALQADSLLLSDQGSLNSGAWMPYFSYPYQLGIGKIFIFSHSDKCECLSLINFHFYDNRPFIFIVPFIILWIICSCPLPLCWLSCESSLFSPIYSFKVLVLLLQI